MILNAHKAKQKTFKNIKELLNYNPKIADRNLAKN